MNKQNLSCILRSKSYELDAVRLRDPKKLLGASRWRNVFCAAHSEKNITRPCDAPKYARARLLKCSEPLWGGRWPSKIAVGAPPPWQFLQFLSRIQQFCFYLLVLLALTQHPNGKNVCTQPPKTVPTDRSTISESHAVKPVLSRRAHTQKQKGETRLMV